MTSSTAESEAAGRIASKLTYPGMPAEQERRFAQSLAKGAAGTALLHIERALLGYGTWLTAHRWLKAATGYEISASAEAALFIGAPCIDFVLHAACADETDRYSDSRTRLSSHVINLAYRRVEVALARIGRRETPQFAEYDLFYGLTGVGALLLRHHPGSDALGEILHYLVRLTTEPLYSGEGQLPGWWVGHDPDPLMPTPGGHANFGIAHGISGPLALLSLAMRSGVTVEGHLGAIEYICRWLECWQQESPAGRWWPQWITRSELREGRSRHQRPPRPSWCYGTPGIARSLQLAAIAIGNTARQAAAEHALAASLADQTQLAMVIDAGLCHGIAGLYQTAWRTAQDSVTERVGDQLPVLAALLLAQTGNIATVGDAGLLDGTAGVALALYTAAHDAPPLSGWDTCLLIT